MYSLLFRFICVRCFSCNLFSPFSFRCVFCFYFFDSMVRVYAFICDQMADDEPLNSNELHIRPFRLNIKNKIVHFRLPLAFSRCVCVCMRCTVFCHKKTKCFLTTTQFFDRCDADMRFLFFCLHSVEEELGRKSETVHVSPVARSSSSGGWKLHHFVKCLLK